MGTRTGNTKYGHKREGNKTWGHRTETYINAIS